LLPNVDAVHTKNSSGKLLVTGQPSNQLNYVPNRVFLRLAVKPYGIRRLQVSHTAHVSLALPAVASVPAETANKPLIKFCALMT